MRSACCMLGLKSQKTSELRWPVGSWKPKPGILDKVLDGGRESGEGLRKMRARRKPRQRQRVGTRQRDSRVRDDVKRSGSPAWPADPGCERPRLESLCGRRSDGEAIGSWGLNG